MPNQITIRAPKFELYQLVTLYWNQSATHTKIVKRFYDPDDSTWLYLVANDDTPYPESVFEARED